MVGSFFVLGPFMLPLIWTHPTMSRAHKFRWSLGMGLAGLAFLAVVAGSLWQLYDLYAELQRTRANIGLRR